MATLKTYVAMILDKSGSMNRIVNEARNNFNEQIQVLKEESNSEEAMAKKILLEADDTADIEGIETHVSVVTFNQEVDFVMFDEDVNSAKELDDNDYTPSGATALFDAIGLTIEKFQKHYTDLDDPNVGVLFNIITDGEENSSTLFSGEEGRKRLKSLMDELQDENWTFTFMGTENVMEQAMDLGFSVGNTAVFTADAQGMQDVSSTHAAGLRGYYSTRAMMATSMSGSDSTKSSIKNFYSSVEEDDEE